MGGGKEIRMETQKEAQMETQMVLVWLTGRQNDRYRSRLPYRPWLLCRRGDRGMIRRLQ